MFEAYAIGVTLRLNNLVSPQLALIAGEFERLEGLAVSLAAAMKRISMDAPALRSIARGADASNIALERATRSATAFERRLESIKATAATLPINAPIGPALAPGGGGRGVIPTPGGGGGGAGGGGGNHRPPGGFHGGNVHMGPNGVGIGTVGMAAGDAFVPLAVTAGLLYGGHALYESAKDLNTEMQRFKLFGLGDKINEEAFKFVRGMRVYGTTQAENMRNFREAQGVFRESGLNDSEALEGAKLAAPVLARLDFLSESLDENSKATMKTANMAMLRYVELSGGLKSPQEFNRIADFGYRLNASSGGNVDWEQLRALKTTSGVAGYRLTDDALARLEPIIGEMKGGGVGTALATAFGRISGVVRVPNQIAHQMVDMGVWDKNKVEFNANGGIKRMVGNPLSAENTKLFQENPELFYERVIRPIYAKMNMGAEDIARENLALFGRTGGRLFSAIENALPVIQKSVDAMAKMKGIIDSVKVGREGLSGQEQEFTAAWTDFKTQFGTVMLPVFSGVLRGGSSMFRSMGSTVTTEKAIWDNSGGAGRSFQVLSAPLRALQGVQRYLGRKLFGEPDPGESAPPAIPTRPQGPLPAAARAAIGSPGIPLKSVVFANRDAAPGAVELAIRDVATKPPLAVQSAAISKAPLAMQSAVAIRPPLAVQSAVASKPLLALQSPITSQPMLAARSVVATKEPLAVKSAVAAQSVGSTKAPLAVQSAATTKAPLAVQSAVATKAPIAVQSAVAAQSVVATKAPVTPLALRASDQAQPAAAKATAGPVATQVAGVSPFIAPRQQSQVMTINNKVVMPDGRVLAEVVTREQARDAGRAQVGATDFDGSMYIAPIGLR